MPSKPICSVCGKKPNGITNIANQIGVYSILCSDCLDKLKPFRISTKYATEEAIDADEKQTLEKAIQNNFPEAVIDDLKNHFNNKRRELRNKEDCSAILLTTTNTFEGKPIRKYCGIVSGHTVIGTGFISDFAAGFADFTGSESTLYRDKLAYAENLAIARMKEKAVTLQGNAIVGVRIEHENFGGSMIGITATGTSVIIDEDE